MSKFCELEKDGKVINENCLCDFDLDQGHGWFEATAMKPFQWELDVDGYILRFPQLTLINGNRLEALHLKLLSVNPLAKFKATFSITKTVLVEPI